MRRLLVLGLATAVASAGALAIGIGPAFAHICPHPDEIAVALPATIDVGVTVEDATVPDVEITLPSGLRLDRVDAKPGWTFTRTASVLHYHGGPITAFTCEYFSLGVTAPVAGSFGVTVVQRNAAGAVVARSVPDPTSSTDRLLDQFVYAGVKPPPTPGTSSGPSLVVIGGIALVGVGVVMSVVLAIRGRRARDEDDEEDDGEEDDEPGGPDGSGTADGDTGLDPELQARLDRFRKRKPGSPPA